MNLFIDNNLSPIMAKTLDAYFRHEDGRAWHPTYNGLGIKKDTKDPDWINILNDDPRKWIVLTNDRLKKDVERKLFKNSDLIGIITNKPFVRQKVSMQISKFFAQIDRLEEKVGRASEGSIFTMNANGVLKFFEEP